MMLCFSTVLSGGHGGHERGGGHGNYCVLFIWSFHFEIICKNCLECA